MIHCLRFENQGDTTRPACSLIFREDFFQSNKFVFIKSKTLKMSVDKRVSIKIKLEIVTGADHILSNPESFKKTNQIIISWFHENLMSQ